MSGDRWDICPVCHNLPDEWRDGIRHLYGTVPYEEFKKIESEYNRLQVVSTVRVDCEFGLNDNSTAYVNFSAECEKCGAKWEHDINDIPGINGPVSL